MKKKDIALLLTIVCFTGFFGDMILQLLTHVGLGGPTGWGLNEYFKQHGRAEATCIAAGMMTIFYCVYTVILNLPLKWYYLLIYGVLLDLLFRVFNIFPSLKGYYEHLNYFWSAVWGAIPMLIPLGIYVMLGTDV